MIRKQIFIVVLLHLLQTNLLAVEVVNYGNGYIIDNGRYAAYVSNETGMIESLKISGNDFEIVSDYPTYSLFFVEFVYEYEDGIRFKFDHPDDWDNNDIDVEIVYNQPEMCVIKVVYRTGLIDSEWHFYFEDKVPYIRATIERRVVRAGIYSNFQQCTMYNSDMDNSFIVNYSGELELTMGQYSGNHEFVAPFIGGVNYSVRTAQHSLWTVFDYGSPNYYPLIAWSDNESGVFAGALVTWTSANQRETMSYHGGGSTNGHPGFAEAQWNWFGKSDGESLFLNEGTELSMEMYFYQNEGSIDSLFDFSQSLLKDIYVEDVSIPYSIASWGGRSSSHANYYWRFPQASNNAICSQELWHYKSFSIPRSQNGTWDIHLFSLGLYAIQGTERYDMSPVYGTAPLFSELSNGVGVGTSWGEVRWEVGALSSRLRYGVFEHEKRIRVEGSITGNVNGNFLDLQLSPRADGVNFRENQGISVFAADPLLDTIGITLAEWTGLDSISVIGDTIRHVLQDSIFSFNLYPSIFGLPATEAELHEINEVEETYFKNYFKPINQNTDILTLPSVDYYLHMDGSPEKRIGVFTQNQVDSIFIFQLPFIESCRIYDDRGFYWDIDVALMEDSISCISFPFIAYKNYVIDFENDSSAADPEFSDLRIYPNPAQDHISLLLQSSQDREIKISTFNILGAAVCEVDSWSYSATSTLSREQVVSHLAAGIYFIRLEWDEGVIVKKFTVLR